MNRLYYFLLPLLALSCIGKHKSDAPKVIINPTVEHSVEIEADTLIMNLEKSKIEWVATEMQGSKVFDDPNRLQKINIRGTERRYLTIGKAFKVFMTVIYTV